MKIRGFLFAGLTALSVAQPAQALELVLRPAEVLDLARAPKGDRSFTFDKVTLADRSVILVPSSFRNTKLVINELRSTGTAYIVVYDDEFAPPQPVPATLPRAGRCAVGAAGQVGAPGGPRHNMQLNLTIGFSSIDKLVVLAEGLQGFQGGKGGNGQNGGDSGGGDRCVLQPCNGGDGGPNGLGGPGGPAGDGADVVLDFSGLAQAAVTSHSVKGGHQATLIAALGANPEFKEKVVNEYKNDAGGFLSLLGAVGQAQALALRGGPSPSSPLDYAPGVHIVTTGGDGGGSGPNGDLTGGGGAGYDCTLGRTQDGGRPGVPIFVSNVPGAPGKPGKVTLHKLD